MQEIVSAELAATARAQMIHAPPPTSTFPANVADGNSNVPSSTHDASLQPASRARGARVDVQADIISAAEMNVPEISFMAQGERNMMVENCLAKNAYLLANLC